MPFDIKFLAALALMPALAACGSPAEEADDPVAQNAIAPSSDAQSVEPATSEAETASNVEATEDEAQEADATPGAAASPTPTPSPTATTAARPAAATPVAAAVAPPMWAVCSACHSVEPGQHGIGPSLAGIFNAKAASRPGFDYSEAMENSGLTWDQATLDAYLENPRGVVPGTTMAYNGLKNEQQRQAVVAYLRGL